MAEDEIIKHTRKAFRAWSDPETSLQHKVKEILLEIAIIVFAVTVSIWLHNVSERSKDRREEKEFLSGLKEDLNKDLNEMKGDSAAYRTVLNGTLYFTKVGAGQPLNTDSLHTYAWIFFAGVHKQSRTSRFEALKGSGKLDVIENKKLLSNIISLYQELFPTIAANNLSFSEYTQNHIGTFLDTHARLDSADNILNWSEMLHMSEFRMGLIRANLITLTINSYATAIEKCNEIIKQIDAE